MSDYSKNDEGVVSDGAPIDKSGDFSDEGQINTGTGDEGISGNEISKQELSDVSTDNIIEGERSTRGKDFNKGDEELDAAVEEASAADPGQA